jgi:hypothetical protein
MTERDGLVERLLWTPPFHADAFGSYVLDAEGYVILQIRGWGHLAGVGGLHLSEDEAIGVQKARGEAIAAALNAAAALSAAQRLIGVMRQDISEREAYLEYERKHGIVKNDQAIEALREYANRLAALLSERSPTPAHYHCERCGAEYDRPDGSCVNTVRRPDGALVSCGWGIVEK